MSGWLIDCAIGSLFSTNLLGNILCEIYELFLWCRINPPISTVRSFIHGEICPFEATLTKHSLG
jgi:hypothetical protein